MRNLRLSLPCILIVLVCASPAFAQHVYFGNLHSHTSYSDGSGTPEEAYRHARDVGKLDFLAITEHNHSLAEGSAGERADGLLIAKDHGLYEKLKEAAAAASTDGSFVGLYGQEVSSISQGNHVNVFDVSEVVDEKQVPNGRFDRLVGWLGRHLDSTGQSAVLQLNHPFAPNDKLKLKGVEYGIDDFASAERWRSALAPHVRLLELLNGPAMSKVPGHRAEEFKERAYLEYLARGLRVAPVADQDNHYRTWGTSSAARTGILAERLTKRDLLEAIRARHVYATEDANLEILFRINGRLSGDSLEKAPELGTPLTVEYRITDRDEPGARYRVELWSGEAGGPPALPARNSSFKGNTEPGTWKSFDGVKYEGGQRFLFLKVAQASAQEPPDQAWTAPVWLTPEPAVASPAAAIEEDAPPAAGAAGQDLPSIDVSSTVASRSSKVYHVSLDCRNATTIKPGNRLFGPDALRGRRLHAGCPKR